MEKFNLYKAYLQEMNKLNPFQFKKLINALSEYADSGVLPRRLSYRSMCIFTQIQRVITVEKDMEILSEKRSMAGKKGMKHRWDNKNNKTITKK